LIKVTADKELPEFINVGEGNCHRVYVEYAWRLLICIHCKLFVHDKENCDKYSEHVDEPAQINKPSVQARTDEKNPSSNGSSKYVKLQGNVKVRKRKINLQAQISAQVQQVQNKQNGCICTESRSNNAPTSQTQIFQAFATGSMSLTSNRFSVLQILKESEIDDYATK